MKTKEHHVSTFLLCLTLFCLFADQNLMAPNLTQIATDLGLSEIEKNEKLGGQIAVGFFIIGGTVALVMGYVADISIYRCALFASSVIFGQVASASVYWVTKFEHLFFSRCLTGISVGGGMPIIFSLLGDMYPDSSRVYVSTIVSLSVTCGTMSGQIVSGIIGPEYGWRYPFYVVAAPCMVCAVLVLMFLKDPPRGTQEKAFIELANGAHPEESNLFLLVDISEVEQQKVGTNKDDSTKEVTKEVKYTEIIDTVKLGELLTTWSVVVIFFQGVIGCLPWGMMAIFFSDYLANERGMTVLEATQVLTLFSIGGFAGQVMGGWIGQKLFNIDSRLQCLLMSSTTIFGVLPMHVVLNSYHIRNSDPIMSGYVALAGFFLTITGPNIKVVLQNVCVPEIRGTAFALFALTDDVGKGLGPAVVVMLIKHYDNDRGKAFNAVTLAWVVCGMLLATLVCTVQSDEKKVQARIEASLKKQQERKR